MLWSRGRGSIPAPRRHRFVDGRASIVRPKRWYHPSGRECLLTTQLGRGGFVRVVATKDLTEDVHEVSTRRLDVGLGNFFWVIVLTHRSAGLCG